ncbi:unnamed protein product [Coregonus sp. 'balchen']|nr:unnamed protein product [Coregonus sp. 'balchen']
MVLMTEQPDRDLTPLSTPEQVVKSAKPVRKDSTGIQSTSEAANGGEDRPRRSASGRSAGDTQVSVDTESDLSEIRKKPALMKFKAVELPSPMQTPSDGETKFEGRKKSQSSQISKSNAQYHKIFKEISKDELLKQSYTCALQKDMLYQGKMFVSDNWICFHSKIAIPVLSVTLIKKTKTAILVPNALVITTTNKRDLSGDFSDLDGVVCQRRQAMLETSSSGSQTPDYEKMTEFPSIPDTFLSAGKNGEVAVHADVHLQTPNQKHGAAHQNGPTKPAQGVVHKVKSLQPVSLNTLLLIYLFLVSVLVLSSCYMAFKIVALEKRLNSLSSVGEYARNENVVHHRSQDDFNAEIYGELSTNLFKLEKVCRLAERQCQHLLTVCYSQKKFN